MVCPVAARHRPRRHQMPRDIVVDGRSSTHEAPPIDPWTKHLLAQTGCLPGVSRLQYSKGMRFERVEHEFPNGRRDAVQAAPLAEHTDCRCKGSPAARGAHQRRQHSPVEQDSLHVLGCHSSIHARLFVTGYSTPCVSKISCQVRVYELPRELLRYVLQ